MFNTKRQEKEEMCDCGEPGCEFTKKEAEEFAKMRTEYMEAVCSNKPDSELNSMQHYFRQSWFNRPPWMNDTDWKKITDFNAKQGKKPMSMEEQLFSQVEAFLDKKKE
jgi:hypothetical protein